MKEVLVKRIPVKIIDDAMEVTPDSIDELASRFQTSGEEYSLIVGGYQGASMLYKIQTPFIKIDDPKHKIFEKVITWFDHEYNGLELIARLAHPGETQICHYEDGSAESYPEQVHESWNLVFHNYLVLLQKNNPRSQEYPKHLVFGKENCQNQLEVWGITNLSEHLDGLD